MWQQAVTDSITNTGIDYRAAARHAADYAGAERRRKPRIKGPFPVVVTGVDSAGETFEVSTVVDDISAGGLYLRLRQRFEPGATFFLVASLSAPGGSSGKDAPRLALHCVVLRAELMQGGACGAAVAISNYRFL